MRKGEEDVRKEESNWHPFGREEKERENRREIERENGRKREKDVKGGRKNRTERKQ